jgi:hypothetical protein
VVRHPLTGLLCDIGMKNKYFCFVILIGLLLIFPCGTCATEQPISGESSYIRIESEPRSSYFRTENTDFGVGEVYGTDRSSFLGFTPVEIFLEQGLNKIEIYYEHSSYKILFDLDGSIVTIKKATWSIATGFCFEAKPGETSRVQEWEGKMKNRSYDLKRLYSILRMPGDIQVLSRCSNAISFMGKTYHSLSITSDPIGATVVIDKKNYGVTPKSLKIGTRFSKIKIMVSKKGFVSKAFIYSIKDDPASINIKLNNRNSFTRHQE